MDLNLARRNSGSSVNWPMCGQISHFSVGEQVRIIMECALVRYPQADLGPETIAAFKSDWADLLRSVGTQRFLTAAQRACQSTTFFPLVADIVKHIPPALPPLLQYSAPTAEDLRRKAAGERSYGVADVRCLSALHRAARAKAGGRALTDEEMDELLIDLDNLIDIQQKHGKQTAGRL